MTEEERRQHAVQARREYPETERAFDRVREAMMARLFKTTLGQKDERELLYRSVQSLNAAMASAKIDQQTTLAYEQSHETSTE